MTYQMLFVGLFAGYMTRFFYRRIHKTKNLILVPVYFLLLLFFGFIFVIVIGIVIYIHIENDL